MEIVYNSERKYGKQIIQELLLPATHSLCVINYYAIIRGEMV